MLAPKEKTGTVALLTLVVVYGSLRVCKHHRSQSLYLVVEGETAVTPPLLSNLVHFPHICSWLLPHSNTASSSPQSQPSLRAGGHRRIMGCFPSRLPAGTLMVDARGVKLHAHKGGLLVWEAPEETNSPSISCG